MRALRAPCPPLRLLASTLLVGTAYENPSLVLRPCQRLCPPYKLPRGRTESVALHAFTYSVCSPDGAQRNPGTMVQVVLPLPHFASLNAGYKLQAVASSQRKSAPVCGSGPGGRPHSASSVSLAIEGDGAPTRRCLDCSRLEWSGREASRPAPCGAPTRHLGLYAFDRGRTGPAPSGRRGCPSTARGRRLRLPSLAGAAPVPRLQNASGRRPSKLGSG